MYLTHTLLIITIIIIDRLLIADIIMTNKSYNSLTIKKFIETTVGNSAVLQASSIRILKIHKVYSINPTVKEV